jgi:predicted nucleic acid-binding protein
VRAFFDTNVLVYAFSGQDPLKGDQALRLIEQHRSAGSFVISTQVMVECFNVLARKRRVAVDDVLDLLRALYDERVVSPTARATLAALEMAARHGLSPWDAMVVQAAIEADCAVIYSEDLQNGRRFGRLEILNPFHPAAHDSLPTFGSGPAAGSGRARKAASPRRRG